MPACVFETHPWSQLSHTLEGSRDLSGLGKAASCHTWRRWDPGVGEAGQRDHGVGAGIGPGGHEEAAWLGQHCILLYRRPH